MAERPALDAASHVELSFAIVEPQKLPSESEFGWSLDPNDVDVGLVPLGDLLCQCGVRWVKFPFLVMEAAAGRLRRARKKRPAIGQKEQTHPGTPSPIYRQIHRGAVSE